MTVFARDSRPSWPASAPPFRSRARFLTYGLLALWRLASDDDRWLRLLSVAFGCATIPAVYALGAALFSRAAGLWGATLLSVTYVHVRYSQEARMYALMVLLFALALWGLVLATRQERPLGWIVYSIFASMLMYTHGLGSLYVAVLAALFPVLTRDLRSWRTWRPWLLSNATVAALFLPWLAVFLHSTREVSSRFWIQPSGLEPPIFTTLYHFTVNIPPLSQILSSQFGLTTGNVLGRWVWFTPILFTLLLTIPRAGRANPRPVLALALAYVLPIAILSAVSLIVAPVLIPRVLLPTVVPIVLLLGSGVDFLSTRRFLNHAVLATVAGVLLLGTVSYHRWAVKEEWRETSHYLDRHAGATDILLFDSDSGMPSYLVRRYDAQRHLSNLAQLSVPRILAACSDDVGTCLSRAFQPYQPGQVVWVIHSHGEFLRDHGSVQTWLTERLERLEVREFEGILVERKRLGPT